MWGAMGGVCGVGPVSQLWFREGGFEVVIWEEGLGLSPGLVPKLPWGPNRVVPAVI